MSRAADNIDFDFDFDDDLTAHPFVHPPEPHETEHLDEDGPPADIHRDAFSSDTGPRGDHGEGRPLGTRRRLTAKTCPARAAELGFPPHDASADGEGDFITREAASAARFRNREAAAAHGRACKSARTAAWQSIRRQPEVASGQVHGGPVGDSDLHGEDTNTDVGDGPCVPRRWMAHASHDAAAAPGAQIVYCRRCGAWSLGQKSMNLTRPCSMQAGHKGNLRLLGLGIAPRRGARVPAELKKSGARGTRGGLVARRISKRRGGR